jgi:hypothetical protein
MLADGGECVADLAVTREQESLFGPVASDSTAFRVIDRIAADRGLLEALRSARARARERFWRLHGAPERLTIDVDPTWTAREGRRRTYATVTVAAVARLVRRCVFVGVLVLPRYVVTKCVTRGRLLPQRRPLPGSSDLLGFLIPLSSITNTIAQSPLCPFSLCLYPLPKRIRTLKYEEAFGFVQRVSSQAGPKALKVHFRGPPQPPVGSTEFGHVIAVDCPDVAGANIVR